MSLTKLSLAEDEKIAILFFSVFATMRAEAGLITERKLLDCCWWI
jgi:hypothetical protein